MRLQGKVVEIDLVEYYLTAFLANPGLLPLATLRQTDFPQALLAQVAEQVDRISEREQRQNIAGCAEILAGLRFEKDLIRQFFPKWLIWIALRTAALLIP